MKLFSPAKINLYLKVVRKRSDGYHDIETLFERISLSDTIFLKTLQSNRIEIKTSSKKIPKGSNNIAYQAAKLLKDTFHLTKGVRIEILKKIPVSAGLGGGSSNAASVLVGLNKLWNLELSKKKLIGLGTRLGSDVPFFILDTSFALGKGRGEILTKVNAPKVRFWHCLVKPSFGISTKKAYQSLSATGLTPQKPSAKMLLRSLEEGNPARLGKLLINSLEQSDNKRVREILKTKEALIKAGAFASLMSGSGSSVFGIFKSKNKAFRAAGRLRELNKNWKVFVVSTF